MLVAFECIDVLGSHCAIRHGQEVGSSENVRCHYVTCSGRVGERTFVKRMKRNELFVILGAQRQDRKHCSSAVCEAERSCSGVRIFIFFAVDRKCFTFLEVLESQLFVLQAAATRVQANTIVYPSFVCRRGTLLVLLAAHGVLSVCDILKYGQDTNCKTCARSRLPHSVCMRNLCDTYIFIYDHGPGVVVGLWHIVYATTDKIFI